MRGATIPALVAGFAACAVVPSPSLAASAHGVGAMPAGVRREMIDGRTLVWWDRKWSAYMGASRPAELSPGRPVIFVDVLWINEIAAAGRPGSPVATSGIVTFDCRRRLVKGSDGEDEYYADGSGGNVTGGPVGPTFQSLWSANPAMRAIAARVCR
jgi:hypothetical protein